MNQPRTITSKVKALVRRSRRPITTRDNHEPKPQPRIKRSRRSNNHDTNHTNHAKTNHATPSPLKRGEGVFATGGSHRSAA